MRTSSVLLALLAVAACRSAEPVSTNTSNASTTTPPSGSPTVSEPSAGPVTVRVAVDPATVAPDGRLTITVTATNATNAPRTLEFSSGCTTDYELLDATGAVVTESGQMCTQALTQQTLAPGASLEGTHVLVRGMRGMPALPAGAYQVRGVLLTMGDPVRSAPVPVTLR